MIALIRPFLPAIASVLLIFAAVMSAYLKGRSDGEEACQTEANSAAVQAIVKDTQTATRAAEEFNAQKGKVKDQEQKVITKIRTIYEKVPVPADCAAPDELRRVLDNAISAASNTATATDSGGTLRD
jgi:hypothetical protein